MSSFKDFSFAGKKALIRVDFNVPLNDAFEITDDNRMRATIPTITKILMDGGSVILMSHLGRPKEGPTDKYSLKHIVAHLSKLLGVKVQFANDCIGAEAMVKAAALQAGQVLLLENLRFYKEEEKGDLAFAEKLAKLGDVYVNDAFGTAHRAHASTAIIAQFFSKENRTFGLVMEGEVMSAEKVMHAAQKPFTAIIGGAKVSDKILIIENLLERATDIIIGGISKFVIEHILLKYEIGLYKENQPSPHDVAAQGPVVKMTFGKYKDKEIRKIPIWYRKWMLENIKWTPFNKSIQTELLRLKEIGI